jgi:5-methylcytosine-specific restriction protein A
MTKEDLAMSSTIFKGTTVTRQDILKAMGDFDAEYPDANTYDKWLDKDIYRYAVHYGDKPYPCKYILSQASGIPIREFSGGEQTNRVFRDLGFDVVNK